jgi:hypothetical protein
MDTTKGIDEVEDIIRLQRKGRIAWSHGGRSSGNKNVKVEILLGERVPQGGRSGLQAVYRSTAYKPTVQVCKAPSERAFRRVLGGIANVRYRHL